MQLTDRDSRILKSLGVEWDEPTARLVDQLEDQVAHYKASAEGWCLLARDHFYSARHWRMAFCVACSVVLGMGIIGGVCWWVIR